MKSEPPGWLPASDTMTSEAIIMVGYPGAGKSTYARALEGYHRIDGDVHKTAAAMCRAATAAGLQNVVFDSTGGTRERRATLIKWARERGLSVRIVWIQTSMEEAMRRNAGRPMPVPKIAYYTFRKRFEPPDAEAEGVAVTIVTGD